MAENQVKITNNSNLMPVRIMDNNSTTQVEFVKSVSSVLEGHNNDEDSHDLKYKLSQKVNVSDAADAIKETHIHDNKSILDATTQSFTDGLKNNYDEAYANSHIHNNKTFIDNLSSDGNGNKFLSNDGTYKYGMIPIASCATASATAEKIVVLDSFTLSKGATISVTFACTNSAPSPTLNVNSTGAKQISSEGGVVCSANNPLYVPAGATVEFTYNGSCWVYKNRIVSSYVNGASWYRKYANGFKEQGGSYAYVGDNVTGTITFLAPFKDTNYTISLGTKSTGAGSGLANNTIENPTATSFSLRTDWTGTNRNNGGYWLASGY